MFDIGFAELVIIGVVALVVIGPERLPGAVRTATAWLSRIRRGFNEIKQEVQQELHNDEIMRDLRESRDQLRQETESLRQGLTQPLKDAEETLNNPLNMGAADSVTADTGTVNSGAADTAPDAIARDIPDSKSPSTND